MDVEALKITESSGAAELWVRAHPRARKSAIRGVVEGALDVAIAAMPKEGEANEELVRFLAEVLGVPRRSVRVVRGESSRHKRVSIAGASSAAIVEALRTRAVVT